MIGELERISREYDTPIPVFGHAGDGNIHASPMKNPDHPNQKWDELLPNLLRDIYTATAALGGTISGEHGIGHKRKGYMNLVMDENQINIMRKIKRALDPKNVLNPGKIFL